MRLNHEIAVRPVPAKVSKYRNKKVVVDGVVFDSQKEYRRWCELVLLERAGAITDLRRQVWIELLPGYVPHKGRKVPALRMKMDHVYREDGVEVLEDVKGIATEAWKVKRHVLAVVHSKRVREV